MQAQINIVGQIGWRIEDGDRAGTFSLIDLVPLVRAAKEAGATTLLLGFNSPGGYVDDGNEMYDYLMSEKAAGLRINSTTIPDKITGKGLVGSIATKLYLVGDEREIDPLHDEFFIHNPWADPGPSDGKRLLASGAAAIEEEDKLRSFYCSKTNNTPEALSPFMDAETALPGHLAIKFGFATKVKAAKTLLQAKVKMSTTKNTLKGLLADLTSLIKGDKNTKAIKFVIKADANKGKLKADVTISGTDGAGYVIDGDAVTDISLAKDAPIFTANPDGTPSTTPAPDGDITTADGNVITVAGGIVSSIKQATAMENKELAAKVAALENSNKELLEGMTEMVKAIKALAEKKDPAGLTDEQLQALVDKKSDAAILALKKEIGSAHIPNRTKAEQKKAYGDQIKKMSPMQLKNKYPDAKILHGKVINLPADIQKLRDEEEVAE